MYMEKDNIKSKIEILSMTYDGLGKLTKFQDDIYGFVDETNKVRLIDLVNNKIFDTAYNIRYIGEDIILLNNFNNIIFKVVAESVILDRHTFKIIEKQNSEMMVCNELIVSKNYNSEDNCILYDLQGRKIWEINKEEITDIEVKYTDSDDYYIISYFKNDLNTEQFRDILDSDDIEQEIKQKKNIAFSKI